MAIRVAAMIAQSNRQDYPAPKNSSDLFLENFSVMTSGWGGCGAFRKFQERLEGAQKHSGAAL
jgi:hypothetical protein